MRLLSVIPALLLFLSNVPITMEMNVTDVCKAETMEGGCSKSESRMGSCNKKESSCGASTEDCSKKKTCSQPSSSTCICTCLFQYSAPAPVLSSFQPVAPVTGDIHTGFLQSNYSDPHLAAPWQPPDLI